MADKPTKVLVATVASFTGANKTYRVFLVEKKLTCSCPASVFQPDKTCKHRIAVSALLLGYVKPAAELSK